MLLFPMFGGDVCVIVDGIGVQEEAPCLEDPIVGRIEEGYFDRLVEADSR